MITPTLQVTPNCTRNATSQFRWKILKLVYYHHHHHHYDQLTAWLDLLYKLH